MGYRKNIHADDILNNIMNRIKPTAWLLILVTAISCNNQQATPNADKITDTMAAADTQPSFQHNHNYAVNVYATVDASPMDMSYYPVEYYKMNMANQAAAPLVVRVIYSRPHLMGRKLFADILKYGEPWRLGANESTEIQLFREIIIQGKKIKPGRYVLYCIPNEKSWTIIFNSNLDTWGLHPDPAKDLFRFEAPVIKVDHHTEYFTIVFSKSGTGADMLVAWDDYEIKLPLEFSLP